MTAIGSEYIFRNFMLIDAPDVNGDKTSTGNPATLIATSQENGGEGVVYVAMNYRLGLFVSCYFS